MVDYTIIGAGVCGTNIARELSKYKTSVLILEKENDVGNHQTLANSAIIHSGHDPKVGSLKATLCVEGNHLYEIMEKELEIPLLYTGAYVLAHNAEEERVLQELLDRAVLNGVPGGMILPVEIARMSEPNLEDSVTKVLSLPSTKVTFPWEVAIACLENAIHNGVEYRKNSAVTYIRKVEDHYHMVLQNGDIVQTKAIINASGVFSDHVAGLLEEHIPYVITPRRGEYFVLDKRVKGFVEHVLYPVPTPSGKGVLIVPQTHGNILIGPTSSHQEDKEGVYNTKDGFALIKQNAKKLAKNIPFDQIIRTFAGVRATSTYDDFYLNESTEYKNFYQVAGIDSPGLTAAPAIAKYVVEHLIKPNDPLQMNPTFDPIRKKSIVFYELDEAAQQELISKNPKYGNVVCKCEKITEAEIVEAIHGPVGSDTVKGIKKRARAGSGFCQGGYCEPLVLRIIARETGKPLNTINYDGRNTPILKEETKVIK
jgi:glycerol-3-phosphate dehydrogenase